MGALHDQDILWKSRRIGKHDVVSSQGLKIDVMKRVPLRFEGVLFAVPVSYIGDVLKRFYD